MRVSCNEGCGAEFDVVDIRKQYTIRDTIYGEVTFSYFQCPNCKRKYLTHTENAKINELIQEMKRAENEVNFIATQTTEEAILSIKRIGNMKMNIRHIQNHLKEKYPLNQLI